MRAAVQAHSAEMARLLPQAQRAYTELHEVDARLLKATQAVRLLEAGYQFDPAEFQLSGTDAHRAAASAMQSLRAANAALRPFEEAARARLTEAVRLAPLSLAVTGIPDAPRLEERAREWAWALSRLEPVFEVMLGLRQDCASLEILLDYRRRGPADNLSMAMDNLCAAMQERINVMQNGTASIRYPFEHSAGAILVSQHLRNTTYHSDPAEQMLKEARSHVEKCVALHQRLLAGLAGICEIAERENRPAY